MSADFPEALDSDAFVPATPARSNDVTDAFASSYPLVAQRNILTDYTSVFAFFMKTTREMMDELHQTWSEKKPRDEIKAVLTRYLAKTNFLKDFITEDALEMRQKQFPQIDAHLLNGIWAPFSTFFPSLTKMAQSSWEHGKAIISIDEPAIDILQLNMSHIMWKNPVLAVFLNKYFIMNLGNTYNWLISIEHLIGNLTDEELSILLDPIGFENMLMDQVKRIDSAFEELAVSIERGDDIKSLVELKDNRLNELDFVSRFDRLKVILKLQSIFGYVDKKLERLYRDIHHDYVGQRSGIFRCMVDAIAEAPEMREYVLEQTRGRPISISQIVHRIVLSHKIKKVMLDYRNSLPQLNLVEFSEEKRQLIVRVFENLIANTVKYARSTESAISLKFRLDKETGEIVLTDDSRGMPQEFADKLGRTGERIRGPNVGDVTGTGNGWDFIGRTLTDLGWTWRITSEVGKGTEIRIKPKDGDVIYG